MEFKVVTNRKEWRKRELSPSLNGPPGDISSIPALQFHLHPPKDSNIPMAEFENLSKDRITMLTAVEQIGAATHKAADEYAPLLTKKLRELEGWEFLTRGSLRVSAEERRKDKLSHFLLRLLYSNSKDRQTWLVQQEVDLFRYRFNLESGHTAEEILKANGLHYDRIEASEKTEVLSRLKGVYSPTEVQSDFFKIFWTEVLELLSKRKICLFNGFAYIPRASMVTPVVQAYRAHLNKCMAMVCRAHPIIKQDDRITELVEAIRSESDGSLAASFDSGEEVTASQVAPLSRIFPLCMREMHDHLVKKGHHKYDGRVQHTLYLKGIGLSLQEAFKYWQGHFAKGGTDAEQFAKKYSYSLRYNYGQEGKRVSYSPYSCSRIIGATGPATTDQCHGCPYKQMDASSLQLKLAEMGLQGDDIEKVVTYKKGGHYQLACGRHFEAIHHVPENSIGVQHPNQFFEEGRKIEAAKLGKTDESTNGSEAVKREPTDSQHEPPSKVTKP